MFVTPYRSREQIASGALTFAIAAGCAVVSTPYWYAQDMLATGAGRLVPFDDPDALAEAVCRYAEQPQALASARAEARRIGSSLAWPSVAEATAAVLGEAFVFAPRHRPAGAADLHLTSLRSDHLLTLVDDVGIVQHAHGIIPNRDSGYCVDDVARLAVVSLALGRCGDEQVWTSILYRALAFLHAAAGDGGMRNFMSYDRRWLDEPHVGDHVGRSVWALGEILATAWIPALVVPSRPPARTTRRRRSTATSRCGRPPTPCSASRASTRTASIRGPAACSSAWSTSSPTRTNAPRRSGWSLVRGRAQLRQRTTRAGTDQRRRGPRARGSDRDRACSRSAGSATSPASATDA